MSSSAEPIEHIDIESDDVAAVAPSGYVWEEEYKRSWDAVQEDSTGSLSSAVKAIQQQRERRRLFRDTSTIQRGIIRHLLVVLDTSSCMAEVDLRPNRMQVVEAGVSAFIGEYFDQNPISQLGTVALRDGIAEKLSDLSGNPIEHVRAIQSLHNRGLSGEPSLQNALSVCRTLLRHVPHHGSREILIVLGSLTSCDPGDVRVTAERLREEGIRVSIIGLAAEVQVCKVIASLTGGTYSVVMNESHFKDILFEAVTPPATTKTTDTTDLVKMGFPRRVAEKVATFCMCHHTLARGGYICPACGSKMCEIPQDCRVCGLTLVSSPHLARSYHHLFPIPNFSPVSTHGDVPLQDHCFSCQTAFPSSTELAASGQTIGLYSCPRCHNQFCNACDLFIHDILHNCPGCLK